MCRSVCIVCSVVRLAMSVVGLLRRGVRVGLYEGPMVSQLVNDADDRLLIEYYIMNSMCCISCCLNVIIQTIILEHGAMTTLRRQIRTDETLFTDSLLKIKDMSF